MLKVPHGHYQVESVEDNEQIKAEVFCFNRTVESGDYVNDCEMQIKVDIKPNSFKTFLVKYDQNSDL